MNEPHCHQTQALPVLACLGVASRFRLVQELAVADRCVGELANVVGLSQSCTTRHLQALERVGLVKGQREGRRVRFRLRAEAPGLAELLGWALSEGGWEALIAKGRHLAGEPSAHPARSIAAGGTRSISPPTNQGSRSRAILAESGAGSLPDAPGPADGSLSEPTRPAPVRRRNDLEDYLL